MHWKTGSCLAVLLMLLLLALPAEAGIRVPVLLYHNIDDSGDLIGVSPGHFAEQMKELSEAGYKTINLAQMTSFLQGDLAALPEKPIIITFDDGYYNNYSKAYPILRQQGFTAVIFVVADKLDAPGYLTTAQLTELDEQGFDIGSHTVRHKFLNKLNKRLQLRELTKSKRMLEELVGHKITAMAYPGGYFNDEVLDSVSTVGYNLGFTTIAGSNASDAASLKIKRIPVFRYTGNIIGLLRKN